MTSFFLCVFFFLPFSIYSFHRHSEESLLQKKLYKRPFESYRARYLTETLTFQLLTSLAILPYDSCERLKCRKKMTQVAFQNRQQMYVSLVKKNHVIKIKTDAFTFGNAY